MIKYKSTAFLDKKEGLTLLEILVSAAVLITAAVILTDTMSFLLKQQVNAEKAAYAVFLAQEKGEELKAVPWENLVSQPEAEISGCPGFSRSVEVRSLNSYTKQVTIKVYYPLQGSRKGVQKITFERTVDFK